MIVAPARARRKLFPFKSALMIEAHTRSVSRARLAPGVFKTLRRNKYSQVRAGPS